MSSEWHMIDTYEGGLNKPTLVMCEVGGERFITVAWQEEMGHGVTGWTENSGYIIHPSYWLETPYYQILPRI